MTIATASAAILHDSFKAIAEGSNPSLFKFSSIEIDYELVSPHFTHPSLRLSHQRRDNAWKALVIEQPPLPLAYTDTRWKRSFGPHPRPAADCISYCL
jgi:hypothetical protein